MNDSTTTPTTSTIPKPPPPAAPDATQTPPKEGEGAVDNFGYDIPKKEGAPNPQDITPKKEEDPGASGYGDKPKEEGKKDVDPQTPPEKVEEKIIEPGTGYDEESPKKPEEKAAEKKPEEKETKEELELNTETLSDDQAKNIREFAKKHGVTKEVAQALVDQKKEEVKANLQSVADAKIKDEDAQKAQRVAWHKELKDHATFGGEKFAHNIKQAEKVLDEFFPEMKKTLTERGGMLPPYIMRDLSKLAQHLYSTAKPIQGDPITPVTPKEDEKKSSPLDYYDS